jgi:hypothetical protein
MPFRCRAGTTPALAGQGPHPKFLALQHDTILVSKVMRQIRWRCPFALH